MRYKVMYGGRGGGKSWAVADALLIKCTKAPLRILCARELQVSIADSVHRLLSDRIEALGLTPFYKITQKSIEGLNGSIFLFKGIKHNSTEIKSTEGVDICWVEEAEKVSSNSWEVLIPTIRKEDSEIWVTFNVKNVTDATYERFIINRGDNVLIKKVSWRDNPYFPEVLDLERRDMLRRDPEAYAHIWEGEPDTRYSGGVYAVQMDRLIKMGRVVPNLYDPMLPVNTAWDLGYDDATAIWFWQQVGSAEIRLIDYYEANHEDVEHYCNLLRSKPYASTYGRHYVPHDAANKLLAAGGRSIVQQAYALGVKMHVVGATSQQNGIEAARMTLEKCWFDEVNTKFGRKCLMSYHFDYDDDKQMFKNTPTHDWSSHGADAFEIIGQVWRNPIAIIPAPKPVFLENIPSKEIFRLDSGDFEAYSRIN